MVSSEEEGAEERKYHVGILIMCLNLKQFFISYLYIKNTSNKKHPKACAWPELHKVSSKWKAKHQAG